MCRRPRTSFRKPSFAGIGRNTTTSCPRRAGSSRSSHASRSTDYGERSGERLRYVGTWLPEPIATSGVSPDQRAELASDLSMAFLVLLERLAPEERAAFLLREVFDADYGEIARILDKTEPAVRQVVHRAKARVREGRPRFSPPAEKQAELLQRFLDALATDDRDAMLALFAPDASFAADGGGKAASVRNIVEGPERLTRLFLGLEHKYPGLVTHEIIRAQWSAGHWQLPQGSDRPRDPVRDGRRAHTRGLSRVEPGQARAPSLI